MNNEKQKILDMLEKGTITPADAAKLLECLGESQREETALVRQSAQRMKGKKLRVQVEGSTEESEDLHVNVSVPLVLARYADNFLSTCLPASAAEGMKAQGIDLRQLNLGAIVDVFEELEEDIVNVRVKDAHNLSLIHICQEGKWHDIEVEDDVTAYLQFANGATGVFVTTTGDAPGTNRFEVTGTLGKLVCENDKLIFWKLAQDEREFCRTATEGFAQPQCQQVEVETDGENLQHVGVLNAFAGKILHGTPLVAEGTEGLGGLTLSNAMHLSSWLGRAVDIPFDEELFLSELNKRRATSRKKESKDITFSTEGTY